MRIPVYWRGFVFGAVLGCLVAFVAVGFRLSPKPATSAPAVEVQTDTAARLAATTEALTSCVGNFRSSTIVYEPAQAQGLNLAHGLFSIVPGPALQQASSAGLQPIFFVPAGVQVRAIGTSPTLYYSRVQNGSSSAGPIQMMPIANPGERFRMGQPIQ